MNQPHQDFHGFHEWEQENYLTKANPVVYGGAVLLALAFGAGFCGYVLLRRHAVKAALLLLCLLASCAPARPRYVRAGSFTLSQPEPCAPADTTAIHSL